MTLALLCLLHGAPAFAEEPPPPPAPDATAVPADGGLVADEVLEGEEVVAKEFPAIAPPVTDIRSYMPADSPDAQALADAYADFMEEALGADEEANMRILTQEKPGELDAIETAARGIIGKGGSDAIPAAFLTAAAYLHYADLGYSMRPTPRMDEKQAAKFQKMLNTKVYPIFAPVDETARQYLTSISDASADGSDWKTRADALLERMKAENRPPR